MSPILNSETRNQLTENNAYKFVRVGDVVGFDYEREAHAVIAHANRIGDLLPGKNPLMDFDAVEVDDAGRMSIILGDLCVGGGSSTCVIRGNRQEQRQRTLDLLNVITGRTIVDTGGR